MAVIAHFGTFDVENYGDLLFPAILEHRLGDLGHRFVHVSPHGGPPVWNDCVTTVAAEAMINDPPELAGVVVGGGHIIHASPSSLDRYDQGGLSEIVAYPSLWLGAAYLAAQRNLPYCWNAPGVQREFSPGTMHLAEWATSIADYLAVRDRASHSRLVDAGVTRPIRVVPDTALEVARLWSPEQLEGAYSDAFRSRGREVPERTIAVHLNRRYAGEDLDLLAGRLDRIAQRFDATPLLIAMGPCHGDDELQRDVGRRMASEPLVIDRPQSLREITACIARGDAYFGSSLHGMIAACSFGARGMAVIPRSAGTIGKFTGFLEQFQLTRWRAETWQDTEDRLEEFIAAPSDSWARVLDAATPTLDEHWERIKGVLSPPAAQRHEDSTLVDKQGAIDRLAAAGNGATWDSLLYAPIVAEQAIRASEHRKVADEERSQKVRALAEGQRLRAELAGAREQHRQVVDALRGEHAQLRAEAEAAYRVLEEQAREDAQRLRAEADHARLAVEELTGERDRLLQEVEPLRAAIAGLIQLDTQNAAHGEEAELRLAHVAALLVQLTDRVSTKTGKRLLEAAHQGVYRVHAELSQVTRLMDVAQGEGNQASGSLSLDDSVFVQISRNLEDTLKELSNGRETITQLSRQLQSAIGRAARVGSSVSEEHPIVTSDPTELQPVLLQLCELALDRADALQRAINHVVAPLAAELGHTPLPIPTSRPITNGRLTAALLGRARPQVVVFAWDVAHNPVGRALLLADMLCATCDVQIVGARFPRYGADIWPPLRDVGIPIVAFEGKQFPEHFSQMQETVEQLACDLVIVSKPRLPSYELGILAKQRLDVPLVLDIDDYELSFFPQRNPADLDEVKENAKESDFDCPHGNLWTRYCETIISHADAITVSNTALQARYGGNIVRHARDDRVWIPSLYDREALRTRHGFSSSDRVILFAGTAREHKGLIEIASALAELDNPSYKLCVAGTVAEQTLLEKLRGFESFIRFLPNVPWHELPAHVVIGDLVCLLSDPTSEISRFQVPAKLTDALAMEVPVLISDVPPVRDVLAAGVVESLEATSLKDQIDEVFSNYDEYKRRAMVGRELYLTEFSYARNSESLWDAMRRSMEGRTDPVAYHDLVAFHREVFEAAQAGMTGWTSEKTW